MAERATIRGIGTGERWQPVLGLRSQGTGFAEAWAEVLGLKKLLAERKS